MYMQYLPVYQSHFTFFVQFLNNNYYYYLVLVYVLWDRKMNLNIFTGFLVSIAFGW